MEFLPYLRSFPRCAGTWNDKWSSYRNHTHLPQSYGRLRPSEKLPWTGTLDMRNSFALPGEVQACIPDTEYSYLQIQQ